MPDSMPLTLFELRRYRTRAGRRDELIPPSLASGAVPEEPDGGVWIRAFTDAAARRRAPEPFSGALRCNPPAATG